MTSAASCWRPGTLPASPVCAICRDRGALTPGEGINKEDIAAGLIMSIATRAGVMAKRMGLKEHVAFVGGVAKNAGMEAALEKELGTILYVPFEPQITGAPGVAIVAQGNR